MQNFELKRKNSFQVSGIRKKQGNMEVWSLGMMEKTVIRIDARVVTFQNLFCACQVQCR